MLLHSLLRFLLLSVLLFVRTTAKLPAVMTIHLIDVTVSCDGTFTMTSHQINTDLTGTYIKSIVALSFGDFSYNGNISSNNTKITGAATFNDGQITSSYAVVLQKKS